MLPVLGDPADAAQLCCSLPDKFIAPTVVLQEYSLSRVPYIAATPVTLPQYITYFTTLTQTMTDECLVITW